MIATSTAVYGTGSARNNSVVTIYGTSGMNPLNVAIGSGDNKIVSADMTSNTAPSPKVVSASTIFSETYAAFKAFDRDVTTTWLSQNGVTTGWIKYDSGSSTSNILRSYSVSVSGNEIPGNAPKNFTFQGSNNDADWTTLDTQVNVSGWEGDIYKTFYLASYSTPYRYYKLDITAISGGAYCAVGELHFVNAGEYTIIHATDTGILVVGSTSVTSTNTGFALQVTGNLLANSVGVTCFGAIKTIIGSGADVIKEGYNAVMQTSLFKQHPKTRIASNEEATEIAKNEYASSFLEADLETFKRDRLAYYTKSYYGSDTINWEKLESDFISLYVESRKDEFYALSDMNLRILKQKRKLETDETVTLITPISDHSSTPKLFKRNDPGILDIEAQVGCLMSAAQYQDRKIKTQQEEIGSLAAALENQKIVYNEEVDNLYNLLNAIIAAVVVIGGTGGWTALRRKRKET